MKNLMSEDHLVILVFKKENLYMILNWYCFYYTQIEDSYFEQNCYCLFIQSDLKEILNFFDLLTFPLILFPYKILLFIHFISLYLTYFRILLFRPQETIQLQHQESLNLIQPSIQQLLIFINSLQYSKCINIKKGQILELLYKQGLF